MSILKDGVWHISLSTRGEDVICCSLLDKNKFCTAVKIHDVYYSLKRMFVVLTVLQEDTLSVFLSVWQDNIFMGLLANGQASLTLSPLLTAKGNCLWLSYVSDLVVLSPTTHLWSIDLRDQERVQAQLAFLYDSGKHNIFCRYHFPSKIASNNVGSSGYFSLFLPSSIVVFLYNEAYPPLLVLKEFC